MNQLKTRLLTILSSVVLPLGLRAALAAPAIAKAESNAPVTVIDNGRSWTLDNGIVRATINKGNGAMTSLFYHGINTLGGGGTWEQSPQGSAQLTDTVTINPASNGGERAEVAVKGVTGGRSMDIELRYDLQRGASGIYAYGIFSHPASYRAMGEGESRYITRLSHAFNWISVDADRNMLECTPQDWGRGVVIHAKEQRILSTGYYKNSVEHKYSYTAVQYKIPAYGWSSTADHIGVWFINPTTEYLSGGASKMELVAHYDSNDDPDPINLDYWCAGHYAGGAGCNIPAGEQWNKVIGPIFVYCNSLADPETPSAADLATLQATAGNPTVPQAWKDNATALWQDALAQAKIEKAHWPYDWVNGVDYPHKQERGSVTGQLVLEDPQAATTALPHLTVGLAHPDYRSNAGGYVFRSGNALAPIRSTPSPTAFSVNSRRPRLPSNRARPSIWASSVGGPSATASRSGRSDTLTAAATSSTRAMARITGCGVGPSATAICFPTTSPTRSARAITTRTGSSRKCLTRSATRGRTPTPRTR
jgi:rhamnogalacturonan endolyase